MGSTHVLTDIELERERQRRDPTASPSVETIGTGSHRRRGWWLWRVQRRQRGILRPSISCTLPRQGWGCCHRPRACEAGDDQTSSGGLIKAGSRGGLGYFKSPAAHAYWLSSMVDVAAAEIEHVRCRTEAVRRFAYHSALSSASMRTPSTNKSDWAVDTLRSG